MIKYGISALDLLHVTQCLLICMQFGTSCVSKHKLHTGATLFRGDESRNLLNSTQISKEGLTKSFGSFDFENVTSISNERLLCMKQSGHKQQGVIRALGSLESPAGV